MRTVSTHLTQWLADSNLSIITNLYAPRQRYGQPYHILRWTLCSDLIKKTPHNFKKVFKPLIETRRQYLFLVLSIHQLLIFFLPKTMQKKLISFPLQSCIIIYWNQLKLEFPLNFRGRPREDPNGIQQFYTKWTSSTGVKSELLLGVAYGLQQVI